MGFFHGPSWLKRKLTAPNHLRLSNVLTATKVNFPAARGGNWSNDRLILAGEGFLKWIRGKMSEGSH